MRSLVAQHPFSVSSRLARAALLALCVAVYGDAPAQDRVAPAPKGDASAPKEDASAPRQATPTEEEDAPAEDQTDEGGEEPSAGGQVEAAQNYVVHVSRGSTGIRLREQEGGRAAAVLDLALDGPARTRWTCAARASKGLLLRTPGGDELPDTFFTARGPELRVEAVGRVPANAALGLECWARRDTLRASIPVRASTAPSNNVAGLVFKILGGLLFVALLIMWSPALRNRLRKRIAVPLAMRQSPPAHIEKTDKLALLVPPDPLTPLREDVAVLRTDVGELRKLLAVKPVVESGPDASAFRLGLQELEAQVRGISRDLQRADEAEAARAAQVQEVLVAVRNLSGRVDGIRAAASASSAGPGSTAGPVPTPPVSARPVATSAATATQSAVPAPEAAAESARAVSSPSTPPLLPQLAPLLPKLATRDRMALVQSLDEKLRQLGTLKTVARSVDAVSGEEGGGGESTPLLRFDREHRSLWFWISYLKDAVDAGFLPLIANLQASSLDEESVSRRIAADMRGAAQLLAGETDPVDERMDRLVLEFLRPVLSRANRARAAGDGSWMTQLGEAVPLEPILPNPYDSFKPECHEDVDGRTGGQSVTGVIAPGYRFRGQVLVRAVVTTDGAAVNADRNATLAAIPIVRGPES